MTKTVADVLDLFEDNVTHAAEGLGVQRQTIYNWKKADTLPTEAVLRVRNWFLATKGRVPAEWMPK